MGAHSSRRWQRYFQLDSVPSHVWSLQQECFYSGERNKIAASFAKSYALISFFADLDLRAFCSAERGRFAGHSDSRLFPAPCRRGTPHRIRVSVDFLSRKSARMAPHAHRRTAPRRFRTQQLPRRFRRRRMAQAGLGRRHTSPLRCFALAPA